jgi:hypothetical protein
MTTKKQVDTTQQQNISIYKYFSYLVLTLIFFAIIHVIHFRLLHPKIVFFACIADSTIACLLAIVFTYFRTKNSIVALSCGLFIFQAGLTYSIFFPVLEDRSISCYTYMAGVRRADYSLSKEHLQDIFSLSSYNIEKRCFEYQSAGCAVVEGDKLKLTAKGIILGNLFNWNRQLLDIHDIGQEWDELVEQNKKLNSNTHNK